ncbi:putative OSM3-like kinesin, partial [Trypanosoma theileri]
MDFKRTNSSRMAPSSGRSVPPRPPTAGTPLRTTTPMRTATPGPAGSASGRQATGSATPMSQRPPRPTSGAPSSARQTGPGLPRPDSFRRTGTNASISSVNTSLYNNNNNATPMKQLSGKTGGNGRVNVYARVRAFAANETAEDQRQLAVRMKDDTVDIQVPKKGRFTFTFDGTFWSNDMASEKSFSSQEDVFEVIGRPLVENALAGYNAAIMAYGQTGSGKTYTAFGPANSLGSSDQGLIPRVCEMIFERAAASSQKGITYRVSVSMLEVYLEDVFDLLNHRKMVTIRNNYGDNSFHVVGAKAVPVRRYEDVSALLKKAEPLRTFAATAIHDRSSRAHTLFQLEVQTNFESADIAPRASKILLADLAGSERIKLAHTETGLPFEQARNINLSLLALGSCIEAVATRKGYNQNIPEFRNSTLTKLLKEYLGGNSVSAMVVTIAPSVRDAHLSVQTLRFADRAKQMTTHAKINTVKPVDAREDDADKLSEELRDAYLKKKEALFAEFQLQNTIEQLLKKIAILEAQLMEATDDEIIARLQEELEGYQKALADADAQLQEQRRILYPNEVLLEEEMKELNTKMQEMKEEHEDAMEMLMAEDLHKYTEMMKEKQSQHDQAMSQKVGEYESELARLRQLLDEANAKIEQLTAKLSHKKEELRKSDNHIEELQAALKELEDASADMEAELQKQVQNLQGELNRVNAELKEKQNAFDAAMANREEVIRVLEADLEARGKQFEETAAALNALEERYANETQIAEEKQANLQSQLEDMESELTTTEEKLVVTHDALNELQQRHANETKAAEERQTELQSQLENKQAEL